MRSLVLAVVGVLVVPTVAASSEIATAQPHGATCMLSGNAAFKPGFQVAPSSVKYTFKGELSDCQGLEAESSSAKVAAKGTGDIGCTTGTASGKATIKWDSGNKTVVSYGTVDAAAAVALEGSVTKSSEPGILKGDSVYGALLFDADPADCSAGGVRKATFEGQVLAGSVD